MNSCIYDGFVWHHRHRPRTHAFRYRVFTWCLDLDELDLLQARLRWFSRNRLNAISFRDADFLPGGAGPLKARLGAYLAQDGVSLPGGPVYLLAQCRTFGYVFNPISIFYCCDPTGVIQYVLVEVRNTFGEHVRYLLDDRVRLGDRAARVQRFAVDKAMHVSPFLTMACRYDFRFSPLGEHLSVTIAEQEEGQHVFDAGFSGERVPLTDRTVSRLLLRQPFMTATITAGIHWQALRLWLKRLPVVSRPPATAIQQQQAERLAQLAHLDAVRNHTRRLS
jgi:hypothetical protein